jgi:erythromycin esterase
VLHAAAPKRGLFVFPRDDRPDLLTDTLAHRAIGVVYHPNTTEPETYPSGV